MPYISLFRIRILLYKVHYKTFVHFEIENYYCLVPFDVANKGIWMLGFAHTFTLHQRFSINRNKNRIIFLMQSELRIFVPALSAYANLCFLFQKYFFLSLDPYLKCHLSSLKLFYFHKFIPMKVKHSIFHG